ncbi:MAG: hypothetical protein ABR920_09850 [Terriglobales bacterium]
MSDALRHFYNFRVARDPTAIRGRREEHFLQADLNEAALRRTHSRVAEPTVEVI